MKRILLMKDEPGFVLTLTDRLTGEGYSVESTADGESGLERATRDAFDLLLLELMLPRMSGFDVCRELRKRGIETPVIMLTARGQVVDKVVGLKLGADDYVTKPFEMAELLARVEAQLRRAPSSPHPTEGYAFGDLRVDFRKAEAMREGTAVDVAAREVPPRRHFMQHRGPAATRGDA